VSLNAADGRLRWKSPRACDAVKKFAFSTPLMVTVAGQPQLISPGAQSVGGFDPKTGREIWRVQYDGYSVIPRPVFGHGLVYISTGYDAPQVLAIRPDGRGDVTDTHVAWTFKKGAPHTPSLLLHDRELYMVSDNGIASCLDAITGDLIWQQRLGGNYSASPLFGDGKLYFQSESGVGSVLRAGRKFELLASNDLGERTLASYAVVGRGFLIRSAEHLYRIEERSE
jgi:outer membrane protein assembly factor BamB